MHLEPNTRYWVEIFAGEDATTAQLAVVSQELRFRDFPLKEFEFWCIDGVMLLKSEY